MTFAPDRGHSLQAVTSDNVPTRPLPPSWSPHFQSLPRATLAPGKKAFRLQLNKIGTFPNRNPSEEEEEEFDA